MKKQKSVTEIALETIEPVAALTAGIVSYLNGERPEMTTEEVDAIETIASRLRRTLKTPAARMAICNLLDILPTAGAKRPYADSDRQAVERFLHRNAGR